ncbi:MAG: ATP synthase F1 subunit epsilon [Mogibacterium sp.]|nr:ATP synthase F1 subunit epsilon [Mogibacterium sp.]
MDNFKLQIMASDHMVFDGEAKSVSMFTTEGSVGILAHHSNLIMAVVPGELEYEAADAGGKKEMVIVSDGLLKVENGEVMILVDTAEKPEEIDEARAIRAEEAAKEALKRANSNRDVALASAELSRAMSRIKASRNKHNLK